MLLITEIAEKLMALAVSLSLCPRMIPITRTSPVQMLTAVQDLPTVRITHAMVITVHLPSPLTEMIDVPIAETTAQVLTVRATQELPRVVPITKITIPPLTILLPLISSTLRAQRELIRVLWKETARELAMTKPLNPKWVATKAESTATVRIQTVSHLPRRALMTPQTRTITLPSLKKKWQESSRVTTMPRITTPMTIMIIKKTSARAPALL